MVPSRQILPIQETNSIVVASDIVGRDMDVAVIKEKILNRRADVVMCTIPIVETKKFLELILESLTKKKVEVQSRDIIVKTLQDEMGGKRYLLVLDDLWHVDPTLWHEFMDTLKVINTSRGNCILVTTRMKRVASTVAADYHMLEKLAEDHCWFIFKQRAFVDGEIPEELASTCNRIVQMCQGLPLAASVLGGLLRNKEKHEWQAILDGNPLVAGEDDNGGNNLKKILNSAMIIYHLRI
ncbi:hypothetical protein CQW23_24167 [Capsicum baccatum]|uniref:NB-ARC domain-containing protein n=1 Tax=Capsicum baccatum TaxID=33114 RepID=A0A2G2VU13_CAPBA|nr:hypothetical protein CQW23_24167 [Capsicum baccatum]